MRKNKTLYFGEYEYELGELNHNVKELSDLQEIESPDAELYAEYKMEKGKKVYTNFELILPNQMEPYVLTGDQYEIVSLGFLLDWYKKRYTRMCIENFKENEKDES